jgi:2-phospho-L-lactate/phosphoenolpyruvate guanylyltransferase
VRSTYNDSTTAFYSGHVDVARDAAADVAVLVPVKSFRVAKARLAPTLAPDVRRSLARWMATQVVAAVRPLSTFVACDDDEVAEWADQLGASVLWGPGLGLNGAVDEGVTTIEGKGFRHVIITHGDLPLPHSLSATVQRDTIVLVPDRRRDGTNVVARPCNAVLPASYGGGSFDRHLAQALASGFPVTVRVDAHLSLDLDDAADLRHPLVWPEVRRVLAC